jgi:hypothetical protein
LPVAFFEHAKTARSVPRAYRDGVEGRSRRRG